MEAITAYKCEVCGTIFQTEEECRECEGKHRIGTLKKAHIESGAVRPEYLLLIDEDGEEVMYERNSMAPNGKSDFWNYNFREGEG